MNERQLMMWYLYLLQQCTGGNSGCDARSAQNAARTQVSSATGYPQQTWADRAAFDQGTMKDQIEHVEGRLPGANLWGGDTSAGEVFRLVVFDYKCSGAASCGLEVAGIVPWGKVGKLAKLGRVASKVSDGLKLGDTAMAGVRSLDDLAGVVGAACGLKSFSGDTNVLMADGTTKPIADVEVGDMVLAHDPETGERGSRQVTHLWVHGDTLVDLIISGDRVTTTEDHPFWNATDRQWQDAQALDSGDMVLTANGTHMSVVGIDWASVHTGTAYNLTVDDIHTYYVQTGNQPILVHNTGDCANVARRIQAEAGGGIFEIRTMSSYGLGSNHPLEAAEGGWGFHQFVVRDGLVSDAVFTGVPLDEYLGMFPGWSADDLVQVG